MKHENKTRRGILQTFFQTVCGVLFAWVFCMTAGMLPQEPAWKIAVFACIAAAASAAINAVLRKVE